MKRAIKEILEIVLKNVELMTLPGDNPNGNYKLSTEDFDDWYPGMDTITKYVKKSLGFNENETIIVVNAGEESTCQIAGIKFYEESIGRLTYSTYYCKFKYGVIARWMGYTAMLIPESNYKVAQYLQLLDGGGHRPNCGLPVGTDGDDFLEYGEKVLGMKFTRVKSIFKYFE